MFVYDVLICTSDMIRKYTVSKPNPMSGVDLFEICEEPGDLGIACVKINNEIIDARLKLNSDRTVELILIDKNNPEFLEVARHSCAHILANAIYEIYPNAEFGVGPVIEDGFYYDISLPKEALEMAKHAIDKQDGAIRSFLEEIEKRMNKIIDEAHSITRMTFSQAQAEEIFASDSCKLEILGSLVGEKAFSIYKQNNFADLCRGPHLLKTDDIPKHFRLTKITLHQWQSRNSGKVYDMCRIYGVLFADAEGLTNYLSGMHIGKHIDHRVIGSQMQLFHFDSVASGSVFWHHNGWQLFRLLEDYIRGKLAKNGYSEIKTPQLVSSELWIKSGHWDKFKENMFITSDGSYSKADGENKIALKPMSCPCHIAIFNKLSVSYRDLPMRMSEFGCCFRNEPSGALGGLTRLRAFTQDDAHIFCTIDQIKDEIRSLCLLIREIYKDFGLSSVSVKLSDRPEKRLGSDDIWDKSEKMIKEAALEADCKLELNKGEGAFYGPKLEFALRDSLGRFWQCGTVQLDFVLPERLGASYTTREGTEATPVMIHRAILGSLERFIAILLENYNGWLPFFIAPIQATIIPVSEDHIDYAKTIAAELDRIGVRYILQSQNETVSYKIRGSIIQRICLALMVGNKERESNTVTIRDLSKSNPLSCINIGEIESYIKSYTAI